MDIIPTVNKANTSFDTLYLQATEGRDKTHSVGMANAVSHGAGILDISKELCNNHNNNNNNRPAHVSQMTPESVTNVVSVLSETVCRKDEKEESFHGTHPASVPI